MATVNEKTTEVGSYFISNYPPFSFWKREFLPEVERVLDAPPPDPAPLGLYLHIPFCRKRCKFCYFRVYTGRNSREIERYLSALSQEMVLYGRRPTVTARPFRFVYFGGGTPSFLSESQLRGLVERVQAVAPWSEAEEVTFECEPGTLTEEKVHAIREIGVTRLSLGVENFDDSILQENGRAHRSPEILRAYGWARDAGFDQINVDLISGMVGETWENWRECVRKVIDLAPDSLTIYQLELPFNAVYAESLSGGRLKVADWDTKRAWVQYAFDEMAGAGYSISSAYTVVKSPKTRFVYRDALWHGADMLGLGVASFSHVGGVHFQNLDKDSEYLDAVENGRQPLGRALAATAKDLLIRSLILQLKLGRIDPRYFQKTFGVDILEEFAEHLGALRAEGMLETVRPDEVALTPAGLLRVDALLPRFFQPIHQGARYT